jgi:hypothetical protein
VGSIDFLTLAVKSTRASSHRPLDRWLIDAPASRDTNKKWEARRLVVMVIGGEATGFIHGAMQMGAKDTFKLDGTRAVFFSRESN